MLPLVESVDQTQLILSFLTHITQIVDGKTRMPLKTYDESSMSVCDLEDVSTLSCSQVFEVYVESYTGVIARVATITVTFESECHELGQNIVGGSITPLDNWHWSVED